MNQTTSSTAAAIGLFVLVTLPPMEKWKDPTQRVYWQVQVKDNAGITYGNAYRVTDMGRAKALAGKIAQDRKIPIVTAEAPSITEASRGNVWLDQGDLHDITPEEAADGELLPF